MSRQQFTGTRETDLSDFDYINVSPNTLKQWEAEFRRQNFRDMRRYLKQFPDATPEEKNALRSWVRSGHSPYENGDYIANESGGPMDFINALRFWEDVRQEHCNILDDCRQHPDEITHVPITPTESDGDDMPF